MKREVDTSYDIERYEHFSLEMVSAWRSSLTQQSTEKKNAIFFCFGFHDILVVYLGAMGFFIRYRSAASFFSIYIYVSRLRCVSEEKKLWCAHLYLSRRRSRVTRAEYGRSKPVVKIGGY